MWVFKHPVTAMSNNLSSTFEVLIERHHWNFYVKKNKKNPKQTQSTWLYISTYRANENNKKNNVSTYICVMKMFCYLEIKFKDWREIWIEIILDFELFLVLRNLLNIFFLIICLKYLQKYPDLLHSQHINSICRVVNEDIQKLEAIETLLFYVIIIKKRKTHLNI